MFVFVSMSLIWLSQFHHISPFSPSCVLDMFGCLFLAARFLMQQLVGECVGGVKVRTVGYPNR